MNTLELKQLYKTMVKAGVKFHDASGYHITLSTEDIDNIRQDINTYATYWHLTPANDNSVGRLYGFKIYEQPKSESSESLIPLVIGKDGHLQVKTKDEVQQDELDELYKSQRLGETK